MINNKNKLKEIAIKITDYMNMINHNCFYEEEIQEYIDYIVYNVESGNSKEVIEKLMEEYNESEDDELLELINKLKKYVSNTTK